MKSMLKQARIDSGYSLEEIEKKIKVRKKYLRLLEEENFEAIPGEVYAKGYLKLYADFLKIKSMDNVFFDQSPVKERKNLPRDDKKKKYLTFFSIFMLIILSLTYHYFFKGNSYKENEELIEKNGD